MAEMGYMMKTSIPTFPWERFSIALTALVQVEAIAVREFALAAVRYVLSSLSWCYRNDRNSLYLAYQGAGPASTWFERGIQKYFCQAVDTQGGNLAWGYGRHNNWQACVELDADR